MTESRRNSVHSLQGGHEAAASPALTPREVDVLVEVANGGLNKTIATDLGMSEQTVKNHLTVIFNKLDVRTRTAAVIRAIQLGWLRLP